MECDIFCFWSNELVPARNWSTLFKGNDLEYLIYQLDLPNNYSQWQKHPFMTFAMDLIPNSDARTRFILENDLLCAWLYLTLTDLGILTLFLQPANISLLELYEQVIQMTDLKLLLKYTKAQMESFLVGPEVGRLIDSYIELADRNVYKQHPTLLIEWAHTGQNRLLLIDVARRSGDFPEMIKSVETLAQAAQACHRTIAHLNVREVADFEKVPQHKWNTKLIESWAAHQGFQKQVRALIEEGFVSIDDLKMLTIESLVHSQHKVIQQTNLKTKIQLIEAIRSL